MGLVINRYLKNIVSFTDYTSEQRKKSYAVRSCWYNRKTKKTINKITELINLFYEFRRKNKKFYWVTITTCQTGSNTGERYSTRYCHTDGHLFYLLKLWLQHEQDTEYICVAERQRSTQDLHYHLIIERGEDFNIPHEVKRLSELFETEISPSLFEVRRVYNPRTLSMYLRKYVTKKHGKYDYRKDHDLKHAYSSLFTCRTFSCSGRLSKLYKEMGYEFKHNLNPDVIAKNPQEFKKICEHKYVSIYDFNVNQWNKVYNQYKQGRSFVDLEKEFNLVETGKPMPEQVGEKTKTKNE